MKKSVVVFVTGPAAVGKSTVVNKLHELMIRDGKLWLTMSIDKFASSVMKDWFTFNEKVGKYGKRGFNFYMDTNNKLDLEIGHDGIKIIEAFRATVVSVLEADINVICELVVFDENDWCKWHELMTEHNNYWIKLDAPLKVLKNRECNERSSIYHGLAEYYKNHDYIDNSNYQFDTSVMTAGEISGLIRAVIVDDYNEK